MDTNRAETRQVSFVSLRVLRDLRVLRVLTLFLVSQASLFAQAPSIPRTADGKPDLNGIWQALSEANWDIEAHAAEFPPLAQTGAIGATLPATDHGNPVWAALLARSIVPPWNRPKRDHPEREVLISRAVHWTVTLRVPPSNFANPGSVSSPYWDRVV